MTALVLNLSPNPFAASEIMFWMMGSLADRSMTHVWLAAPFIALGAVVLLAQGRAFDALTLGEDSAASLGVNLFRLRLLLVLAVASMVGAATAVAGAVGFVGLVVPHILRPFVGARPSSLLWASALGGAVLVLAADIAVRLVLPDRDLKLGGADRDCWRALVPALGVQDTGAGAMTGLALSDFCRGPWPL